MGTKPSYVAVVAADILTKNVPSSSRFRALQELEVGVEDATPPSVQIGGQGPRSTPKPCSPSSKVVNSNGLALRSKAGHHHLISDNGAPSSVYVISLKEGDVPNVSINKLNFIFGGKGGNFLNVDFNCPHSSSPIAVTSPSCDKENQAYVA
ncbi:hypothetical protein V6N13_053397 [Hibiscus sabdariffa]